MAPPKTPHRVTTLVLDSTFGFRCTCGEERLLKRSPGHRLTPTALTALAHAHHVAVAAAARAHRLAV